VLHAARWKCRTQKIAKNCPSGHHRTNLLGYIFATNACIDNRKKNSNISPTCLHNMVDFGPLAADICWRVWGTPANFNGFRVLAALLHGTLVVSVSQTAALNRGRHLYSAGRPSRWALAHISSLNYYASAYNKGRQLSHYKTKINQILECGPMPNVMVALPNTGGTLCSTPQSLADAHY